MRKDINEFISLIKFGIVGVSNTLVNWIIFFILNHIGVYYITANVIAYLIATANSYFWNSKWVFKFKKEESLKAPLRFILLNLIGLVLNSTILYLLVDLLHFSRMISLIIATGIVMIVNYFINKIWVFKGNMTSY